MIRAFIFTFLCLFFFQHTKAQSSNKSISVTLLTSDFYIYTTYNEYNGKKGISEWNVFGHGYMRLTC